MSDKHSALDKAFDALLDEAAVLAEKRLNEKYTEPEDEISFSEEHKQKMKVLFRKETRKARRRKFAKFSGIAACFLLVLVIGFGATVFSVDAWRVRFLNFVLEAGRPNTDFNFSPTGGTYYSDDVVSLAYIPMGFEVANGASTKSSLSLNFKKEKEYFDFFLCSIDTNMNIDTENGTIEKVTINGRDAIYITTPNINAVVWHNNEYVFRIIGNISKEEMIKIAENARKL